MHLALYFHWPAPRIFWLSGRATVPSTTDTGSTKEGHFLRSDVTGGSSFPSEASTCNFLTRSSFPGPSQATFICQSLQHLYFLPKMPTIFQANLCRLLPVLLMSYNDTPGKQNRSLELPRFPPGLWRGYYHLAILLLWPMSQNDGLPNLHSKKPMPAFFSSLCKPSYSMPSSPSLTGFLFSSCPMGIPYPLCCFGCCNVACAEFL